MKEAGPIPDFGPEEPSLIDGPEAIMGGDPRERLRQLAQRSFKSLLGGIALWNVSIGVGLTMFAIGERLPRQLQCILGVAFVNGVIAGAGLLVKGTAEYYAYLKTLKELHPLSLDDALEILGKPVEPEVATVIRAVSFLGDDSFLPLPQGTSSSLLAGGDGGDSGGGRSLVVRHPDSRAQLALIQSLNLPKRQLTIVEEALAIAPRLTNQQLVVIKEIFAADARVICEFLDPLIRETYLSDVRRKEALQFLRSIIASGDLRRHPKVIGELNAVAVSSLKEGSPEVLGETVEVIGEFFSSLIERERTKRRYLEAAGMDALNAALWAGVSIPGHFEAALKRGELGSVQRHSLVDIEGLEPEGLEALVWTLAAAQLRLMPEVRKKAKEVISSLKYALGTASLPKNLADFQERALKILSLGEEIPWLHLGISLHDLAKKLGLSGAAVEFIPAEELGIGMPEDLGLVALVTLPQRKKISQDQWAQILTRTALAYPFAQFFALSTGRLRVEVGDFESHRAGDLWENNIEMLFPNGAVLDWLLTERNPQDLGGIDLMKRGEQQKEPEEGIVYLPG